METPGKSGLSPVIPVAIHRGGNGAVKAVKADALSHAELEPDLVNKVMKLNMRNKICQVEGLVYDGAACRCCASRVFECLASIESVEGCELFG